MTVAKTDSQGPARSAVRLEAATITRNVIEAVVAVAAGLAAGSVALVAFGSDSAIEIVSAAVVLIHLRSLLSGREASEGSERRALRIMGVTFFALAAYVTVEAVTTLLRHDRPDTSPLGIAVTSVAILVMSLLAWAERHTAKRLATNGGSGPAALLRADAAETVLCATISAAALIGLVANTTLGFWWADPRLVDRPHRRAPRRPVRRPRGAGGLGG